MRRALALVVLTLVAQAPAARGAGDPLDEARAERVAALAEAHVLAARLDDLLAHYRLAEAEAARAAELAIAAYRADVASSQELEAARDALARRARAVYQAGPAGLLEVLLSAGNPSDVAMAQRVIEEELLGDLAHVAEADAASAATHDTAREVVRRLRALARERDRLVPLLERMGGLLAEAEAAARLAGERVRELEEQRRELSAAATRVAELGQLAMGGADQSELLALLGPDGGRGCDVPEGLVPTGEGFSGVASWYGVQFAGRPTASGAIFDPRLFTAAHRTLPLPTFLHVKHDGRCATVLVNDRGPFIEGRVLDLSQGAAEYLGVGLSEVSAEVLVPAG